MSDDNRANDNDDDELGATRTGCPGSRRSRKMTTARAAPRSRKLVAAIVIGLVAIGVIVGGLYWLGNRNQPARQWRDHRRARARRL